MSLSVTFARFHAGTSTPMPPVLDALSPIVSDMDTFDACALIKAAQTPVEALSRLQADAMGLLWPAMAETLGAGRRFWQREFRAEDLKGVYNNVAKHVHVVQMQTPALVPVWSGDSVAARLVRDSAGKIEYAKANGVYGDSTFVANDIEMAFGLVSLVKTQGAERALVSIPTVGIPGWMIAAFEAAGQRGALEALQRIVAYVSHDYYHQMQPIEDNTFFDDGLLSEEDVPDAVADALERDHTPAWWELDDAVTETSKARGHNGEPDVFEHHVLMLHAQVFQSLWNRPRFRTAMADDIAVFIAGVADTAAFHDGKALCDGDVAADHFAFGALTIMAAFISRVAPVTFPVFGDVYQRINKHFTFDAARMPDILGQHGRYYSAEMGAGGMVLANASRMAKASYGIIHTEAMHPLREVALRRSAEEMRAAIRGFSRLNPI
jgi:hypothetical protein